MGTFPEVQSVLSQTQTGASVTRGQFSPFFACHASHYNPFIGGSWARSRDYASFIGGFTT